MDVPIKDLKVILEIAQYHWDRGPDNEGWQSDELRSSCARVEKWLERIDV